MFKYFVFVISIILIYGVLNQALLIAKGKDRSDVEMVTVPEIDTETYMRRIKPYKSESNPNSEIWIVEIEGCYYLEYPTTSYLNGYTHIGNCPNHKGE